MTPRELIAAAAHDGVDIMLAPSGKRLRLVGDPVGVDRWLAIVGVQYRNDIVAELSARAESGPLLHERPTGDMQTSPDADDRASEAAA